MPTCGRCKSATPVVIVSYFTTDELCLNCAADEKLAPGYRAAVAAEHDAVRAGNYNFEGVGLSPEDTAFLDARLQARAKTSSFTS